VKSYVFGGIGFGEEDEFIAANLIPVLYSYELIRRWASACNRLGVAAPSIIKVDTGMTRLGLSVNEFHVLLSDEVLIKKINPQIVMSHLACADEVDHPMNEQQCDLFNQVVKSARNFFPEIRSSLANSSGIFLGGAWHFDLLRPGAALYGIGPNKTLSNPHSPVVSLTLPIIQIKYIESDCVVGYGATAIAKKGSRIAVVAGGYADGLNKVLGAEPEGLLCGCSVKSIGRMSMDLTLFDITDIDATDKELLGSVVEVINSELSLDYLIKKNNSLGYEVLTSLGSRFNRVYIEGKNDNK
jgi:alanine racemase